MIIDNSTALRDAAARVGRPLRQHEIDAVNNNSTRATLRLRFLNVIRLAGYRENAPERICNEHLDEYMKDIPSFVKMLEDYERQYRD